MTTRKLRLIAASLFLGFNIFTAGAEAGVTPIAVGIVPPVQFPAKDYTITGLRLSPGWGRHQSVYGLDLGVLGNITDQTFTGVAVSGLFNITNGTTVATGLQLAGLTNYNSNKTTILGLQAALGANINTATSRVVGVELAILNLAPFTNIYGAQVGLWNRADTVYGLQIGLINFANSLHGIQIGLLNFHHQGLIGVSPILNIGF